MSWYNTEGSVKYGTCACSLTGVCLYHLRRMIVEGTIVGILVVTVLIYFASK